MYKSPFNDQLLKEIRHKFSFVDYDPRYGKRIFFDNSGGSLRLTSSIVEKLEWDLLPDCPERIHPRAKDMISLMEEAKQEIMTTLFGTTKGSLLTELTASQVFFQAVGSIVSNVKGTNVITSNMEHPSAYDALKYYSERSGLEFRVVNANPETGFIEPEDVAALVDDGTVVVSIIAASNISGNIMDLFEIGRRCRQINPEVYFISDAVQHIPHGLMDVEKLELDFVNFAPYKFYASRGIGFGYVSERVALLPHHKLEGKSSSVWELGSPAPALFASMLEVIRYVCWIGSHFTSKQDNREKYVKGIEKISEHERSLLHYLLEGVGDVPGLRHISGVEVCVDGRDLEKRDLIVAMIIEGMDCTEAVAKYQERGITVYERIKASIYSKRIVEALNIEGAIRVSPLHVHSVEDIREFLLCTIDIIKEKNN